MAVGSCGIESTDLQLADGFAYAGFQGIVIPVDSQVMDHEVGGAQRDWKDGRNFAAEVSSRSSDCSDGPVAADNNGGAEAQRQPPLR